MTPAGVGSAEESDGWPGQCGRGCYSLYRPEPGYVRDQGTLRGRDRQEPQGPRGVVPEQGERLQLFRIKLLWQPLKS